LDFGVLTFQPPERGLQALTIGADEMVLLVHPDHPLAGRSKVTLAEFGQQTVVAHSDPSPARERVLRVSEVRHAPINIQIALPSLEAIKRAVELRMGVALLPRRCALTEIARGTLVAVRVPEVRLPRQVRLVYRRRGELSHAATAFLEMVRQVSAQTDKTEMPTEQVSRPAQKPSIARAASAFQPS
jgi:DNA-binding transcriptional LysR family regulator